MKLTYDFRTDEQKLEDYNKSHIHASIDDMELDEIISRDMVMPTVK